LRNALQLVVSHNGEQAASDADIAAAFGEHWRDPASWVLLDVVLGQEISNHTADKLAFIGGSVRRIEAGADGGR